MYSATQYATEHIHISATHNEFAYIRHTHVHMRAHTSGSSLSQCDKLVT
jgi:hypothetical protein